MSKIKKLWPILLLILLIFIFFWKFFLKGLLPIPADIIVGLYYPWLDYKWGYEIGVPVKNNLISDVVSVMYPFKIYAVEVLKSRSFPLWNPLSFCGSPLFANFQSGIFYPLTLLYFALPNTLAWSFQVIAQPFLAAFFAYLFLRNLKLGKVSSLLGGLIYAYSGFSIIWLEYNIHGHVAAFVPLLFLLVDKFLEKRIWGVPLSGVLAIQIFAGYPQVTLYSLLFLGFYFIYRLFEKKEKRKIAFKVTVIFVFFILLGLCLAAVQLLPGFELLRLSQRMVEGVPGGESVTILPWQQLVTLLAPDFFGNPVTGNFWFKGDYNNTVGYVGIITLSLVLICLIWVKRRDKLFFFFSTTAILLYVLLTPITSLIRWLNLFAFGAAVSTRALSISNFTLAVLASFGFDSIWQGRLKKKVSLHRPPFYLLAILLGLGVGVFLAANFFDFYEKTFSQQAEAFRFIHSWVVNLRVSLRNLILPSVLALTSVILFWLREKVPVLNKFLLLIIFSFLTFELFRFGWKYTTFTRKDLLFPETPVIEFLNSQEKPFRILGGNVVPMNMWSAFELKSPAGYDAVYPLRYAKFLTVVNGGQVENPAGRYGDIQRFDLPLLNLTNTKYILSLKYDKFGRVDSKGKRLIRFQLPKFKPVFEDKSVQVLENTDVLPRAFIVYDYQVETDEKKIIDALINPDFDLKEKVVLEEKISGVIKTGEVRRVVYHEKINGESRVLVDHEGEGLLFVSDSYFPGWKAFVDGKETKIYRANFSFRAVFVPSGKHEVRFLYRPDSFVFGSIISLSSLIVLLVMLSIHKIITWKK